VELSHKKLKIEIFYYRPNKNIRRQAGIFQINLKNIRDFEKDFMTSFSKLKQTLIKENLCSSVQLKMTPCKSI
jgi:hypothetical protein